MKKTQKVLSATKNSKKRSLDDSSFVSDEGSLAEKIATSVSILIREELSKIQKRSKNDQDFAKRLLEKNTKIALEINTKIASLANEIATEENSTLDDSKLDESDKMLQTTEKRSEEIPSSKKPETLKNKIPPLKPVKSKWSLRVRNS